MRNLRDKLQEEMKDTLVAREQELAKLSHVPDIFEEELTVIMGLSEFNAEKVQVMVKTSLFMKMGIWRLCGIRMIF